MSSSRLSNTDADRLTTTVAELTAAELPLASGLRAAAEESESSRLKGAFSRLAIELDAGFSLERALAGLEHQMPPHVRGMLHAAQRTGHFGRVLWELIEHRRAAQDLWWSIFAAVVYPLLVLAIALVGFLALSLTIRPLSIYEEFQMELPATVKIVSWWGETGIWALLGILAAVVILLFVLRLCLRAVRWRRVVATVPILGPMVHWSGVTEMSRLLAVLIEQQLPLPEALRLTADGVGDAHVADLCRTLSSEVEQGAPLTAAVAAGRRFPAVLVPLIRWGAQTGELAQAWRTAAEMFGARVRLRAMLLKSILPPIAFVIIAVLVLAAIVSLVLPLFMLLRGLTVFAPAPLPNSNHTLGVVNLAALLIVGAALLWTIRIVYGKRNRPSDDALKRVLTTGAWVMVLGGCAALIVSVTGPFSVLVLLLAGSVATMAVSRYRAVEQRTLLWTLAASAEKGVPLHVAARAFADGQSDEMAVRSQRMADLLESGVTLPWAMDRVKNRLPPHVRIAVDLGEQTGALGAALRKVVMKIDENERMLQTMFEKFFYLGLIFTVGSGLMMFIFGKIVPTLVELFEEFEIDGPPITQALAAVSKFLEPPTIGLGGFLDDMTSDPVGVVIVTTVVLAGSALLYFFLTAIYAGWISRDLTPINRWTYRLDAAAIMRWLAVAARGRRSFSETVRVLSRRYPKKLVRDRLRRASLAIDGGKHWCDALKKHKVLRAADAAVLKTAEKVGNLDWALDEMADSSLRRLTYRMQLYLGVLFPGILLVYGAVVMFVAVAIFLPLTEMIKHLS